MGKGQKRDRDGRGAERRKDWERSRKENKTEMRKG